jgi:predicted phosphodiesterase
MRIALISDLHANLEATEAVFHELDRIRPDYTLCLGDLIGYGPSPNEVVSIIRERGIDTLLGNHDAVCGGRLPLDFFREPNRTMLKKTLDLLTPENHDWLKSRPLILESEKWTAAHASPLHPESWTYLDSSVKCHQLLREVDKQYVFVGHTHRGGVVANEFGVFGLKPGYKYVINPGSVGQSRDTDPRASWMMIDLENMTCDHRKVSYDTAETLQKCLKLGFDETQSKRLLAL